MVVEAFLLNASIDLRSDEILEYAAELEDSALLECLLQHGNHTFSSFSQRLFHQAASHGDLKIAKLALDVGIDVNGKDPSSGLTALSNASQKGYIDTVRFLLERGARVSAYGEVALHRAVENGDLSIIDLLLRYGAPVNAYDGAGETALHKAAILGDPKVVRRLMQGGAIAKRVAKPRDGYRTKTDTPIHLAASLGHTELLELLYADLQPDEVLSAGSTPLHVAVANGRTETVRWLLEYGADPSVTDSQGSNSWDLAAEGKHTEILSLLLRRQVPRSLE